MLYALVVDYIRRILQLLKAMRAEPNRGTRPSAQNDGRHVMPGTALLIVGGEGLFPMKER